MNGHIFIRTAGTGSTFVRRAQSETLSRRSRSETLREFLRRQFRGEPTRAQVVFDITVGGALPVLCLVFDPFVFRGELFGQPMAGRFQFFAYSFIAIEIIALGAWLGIGSRAAEWRGVLGGIMLTGVLFSLVIGICLLPFSLFGLMFLIGALGFAPFLTAFIYLRNARRALTAAGAQMTRAALAITLLFGATLAPAAPAFAHRRINKLLARSLPQVIDGDDSQAAEAARSLRPVGWFVSTELDQMVWAYGRTTDRQRRERLARAYREITGGDIERRRRVLTD